LCCLASVARAVVCRSCRPLGCYSCSVVIATRRMRMLCCVQRLARVCERVALLAVSVAASCAFSAVCAAVSQRHGAVCESVRGGAASQALRFAALVLVAAAASGGVGKQSTSAPRWRERPIQWFGLSRSGGASAAKRPMLRAVSGLRAQRIRAVRGQQPNHSIERTNNGGRGCAAPAAVCAPLFAAHVGR
jgi:hypothetical protein